MLEGLAEIQKSLKKKHIEMVIKTGKFAKIITEIVKNACEIIVDAGYLKFQRKCRLDIAKKISCKLTQIETNLIVPPERVWPKEEYSAKTFRQKINKSLNRFLVKPPQRRCIKSSLGLPDFDTLRRGKQFKSLDVNNPDVIIKKLKIDQSVGKTEFFKRRDFFNHRLRGLLGLF